jgi:hypothetical protein
VTHPATRQVLVVRFFGVGTESFIDRAAEHDILCRLSACGFSQTIHSAWPAGRLEGFLAGSSLPSYQLRDPRVWPQVAVRMAQMHCVTVPTIDQRPQLFVRVEQWLAEAQCVAFPDDSHKARLLAVPQGVRHCVSQSAGVCLPQTLISWIFFSILLSLLRIFHRIFH